MIKVSAIIVTFNRRHMLENCLKCLMKQDYKLNNIYVINNDSTDSTKKYLLSLHNPLIHAINLKKNIGGSGGFSLGTKLAYEHSNSNYFWLMDDDSMPTINSLKKLVDYTDKLHNNFGFLCSNVKFHNSNVPTNVPVVAYDWPKLLPGNLIKVKEASFVSLFFSRNIVTELGLPISQMFIWGDDCEYTMRISRHYNSYLVANSIVMHESNNNNNSKYNAENILNSNRANFYKYSYRNYLFVDKKYYGYKGLIKRLMSDTKDLLEIPFMAKNKRIKRCYYLITGVLHGLVFHPKIKFPKN